MSSLASAFDSNFATIINSDRDRFKIVEGYYNLISQNLQKARYPKYSTNSINQVDEYSLLQHEAHTWLLLAQLEQLRSGMKSEHSFDEERHFFTLSDKVFFKEAVHRDIELAQNMVVVSWLEGIYSYEEEYFKQQVLWKNTLFRQRQPLASPDLVSELDPDAPIRQGKSIDSDDAEDEHRLQKLLWNLVRQGKYDVAQQIARDSSQFWRATSISPDQFYHDSLLSDGMTNDLEGNIFHNIWKATCYHLSEEDSLSVYERAIYASLCGNLRQLLPVCTTWEDNIWAYYKSLVVYKIDKLFKERINPLTAEDVLPPPIEDSVEFIEYQIFNNLKNHNNSTIKLSSNTKFHIIQEKIILGYYDQLFILIAEWINKDRYSKESIQLIRFATHLILFFFEQGLDLIDQSNSILQDSCSLILTIYIEYLKNSRQYSLIAYYTSKLPTSLQVITYAKFLQNIKENAEKEKYLLLAERVNLDVNQITKRVVELICDNPYPSNDEYLYEQEANSFEIQPTITVEDKNKIKSIEWLCFDPSQRLEALVQSNLVLRNFILSNHIDAACLLLDDVLPRDSVAVVLEKYGDSQQQTRSIIKEHLCIKLYVDSILQYNKWHSYHFSKFPGPPPTPPMSDKYADQLYHNEKLKQYTEQLTKWEETDKLYSKKVTSTILKLLTYPHGWLIDEVNVVEDDRDQSRSLQLDLIRKQCIPSLFSMLHNVFFESNALIDSVQLATLLVDDYYKLYTVFTPDALKAMLILFGKSYLRSLESAN